MPKNTKKAASKDKQVFDVSKPGKGVQDTGSRPIIVTRKPMVQDPMVKEGDNVPGPPTVDDANKQLNDRLKARKSKLVLKPTDQEEVNKETKQPEPGATISAQEDSKEEPEPKAESVDVEDLPLDKKEGASELTPESEEAKPEEAKTEDAPKEEPESEEEPSAEESSESKSGASDDGVVQEPEGGLVDELAKQAAAKKQQKEEDKEAKVRQEKVDGLIAGKTYVVSISQVTKRRIRQTFLVLLVLVILAVVGLNFAVDAELIDIGAEPLTDLIQN